MSPTVLLVEDDRELRRTLQEALGVEGYRVVSAASLADAQALLAHAHGGLGPDLALVDLGLPDGDGESLLAALRSGRAVPTIVVSARHGEGHKIRLLDAGADDYLTKPFSPAELLARIRALLRRRSPQALEAPVEIAGLHLDPASRRVRRQVQGQWVELRLGPTEFRLLHFLMAHPERVHSRAQLLDRVWGDHVFIEERTVDVHVKRLRESLETVEAAALIETVRGAGYRMALHLPPKGA